MFPLTEWIDRDDVTDEDLVPLTAEVEIFDWIGDTPIPEQRCPDWLPEHEWSPRLQRPQQGLNRPLVRGMAWGWVAAGSIMVGSLLVLSFMASAVGVAFVTLV